MNTEYRIQETGDRIKKAEISRSENQYAGNQMNREPGRI